MTEYRVEIGARTVAVFNRNGDHEGEYPLRYDDQGRLIVFHKGMELVFDESAGQGEGA